MRLLLRHCCVHSASLLSIHKLYGDLSSQGIGLSKDTLYEYVDALEQAGLLFTLPIYDRSLRKQSHNPKKIHVVDPALTTAFSGTPNTDFGHRLENVVFLHERRRTDQLYYARQEHEIDLIVDAPSQKMAVHVAWDMNTPETIRRELAAVHAGEERFPGAQAPGCLSRSACHAGVQGESRSCEPSTICVSQPALALPHHLLLCRYPRHTPAPAPDTAAASINMNTTEKLTRFDSQKKMLPRSVFS